MCAMSKLYYEKPPQFHLCVLVVLLKGKIIMWTDVTKSKEKNSQRFYAEVNRLLNQKRKRVLERKLCFLVWKIVFSFQKRKKLSNRLKSEFSCLSIWQNRAMDPYFILHIPHFTRRSVGRINKVVCYVMSFETSSTLLIFKHLYIQHS